jgi:protein TonB
MATVAVQQDRKNKAVSAIITIAIHAALFLFFLLYIIITPIPPYPEPPGGPELELDFGNGINGTGNVEANNAGNNASPADKASQSATPPIKQAPPVVTNDVENSTTINNSKKSTTTPVKMDTVKPQPQLDIKLASALNKFKTAKGGASGGNGTSGQQGNAGSPTGILPGANTGTGGGPGGGGKGFDFNLNGRQLVVRPKLVTNNPEQGQIVVGITVDQDGNVTEATPGVKGTTINDASLYELVKEAALKTRFNKSSGDTPEQYGTITFRFVIQ